MTQLCLGTPALLILALALARPAWAQAPAGAAPVTALSPIVVTGNPLDSDTLSTPTTVLDGDGLTLRRNATLGDTLNGLPGVSTTTYGPLVGRPIIRGMDGDRIRLLQNGVGTLDASSLSYDHAVPQDPLAVERIEILRGPAALMYGGNAVGGVVNTIDNRIPRAPVDGVQGEVQGSYGSTNADRNGAVQLEAGDGRVAVHADAFGRKSGELRIPGYARSDRQRAADGSGASQPRHRLPNSDGRDSGGALGLSWTGDHGHAGLSYSGYDADYGSVAEDSVRIRMHEQRLGLAGEIRDLSGPFKSVKGDFAYTDYQHKEVDDGETGTIFKNRGYEARIEARHADLGPLRGALGVQFGGTRFSALGAEALVPTTTTDSAALFALEEWAVDDRLTLSAGGRLESTRLSPSAAGNERFHGSEKASFVARSFSLGGVYDLSSIWSVAANASYTERAPTFYELYANGPHEATGQYLVGNGALNKERAYSGDLALRFEQGPHRGSVGVFYSHFANYLSEFNTGRFRDDEGGLVAADDDEALPEAVYRAVPADFFGFEAEGRFRVLERGAHHVDLNLSGDYTHARNRKTGEPLPRIPPLRLAAGLDYTHGPWGAGVSMMRAFAQHRTPDDDTPTTAYYRLDANATYRFKASGVQWLAYVRGINLTNQTIRDATSVLRDVAPAGGRGILVGMRGRF